MRFAETIGELALHPAWEEYCAAHPGDWKVMGWAPHETKDAQDVWDWDVALWMIVRGYGDEIQCEEQGLVYRGDAVAHKVISLPWRRYTLPPLYVPREVWDEERLELNPEIAPQAIIGYYAKQAATA